MQRKKVQERKCNHLVLVVGMVVTIVRHLSCHILIVKDILLCQRIVTGICLLEYQIVTRMITKMERNLGEVELLGKAIRKIIRMTKKQVVDQVGQVDLMKNHLQIVEEAVVAVVVVVVVVDQI